MKNKDPRIRCWIWIEGIRHALRKKRELNIKD